MTLNFRWVLCMQDENLELARLALYWWQRLITFGSSRIKVRILTGSGETINSFNSLSYASSAPYCSTNISQGIALLRTPCNV